MKYEIWNVKLQTWYVYFFQSRFSQLLWFQTLWPLCAKGYKKTFRKAVSSSLGFHVQPWTIGSCEHNLSFQETYILSHSSPEAGSRFGSTQVSTTVACACLLYVYRMSIDMNLLYPYKHILPMDMSHELSTCIYIYIYIHIPYTFVYLYLYIYMYIHTTLTTLMPGFKPWKPQFSGFDCFYSSRPFVDQRPGCSVLFSRSAPHDF